MILLSSVDTSTLILLLFPYTLTGRVTCFSAESIVKFIALLDTWYTQNIMDFRWCFAFNANIYLWYCISDVERHSVLEFEKPIKQFMRRCNLRWNMNPSSSSFAVCFKLNAVMHRCIDDSENWSLAGLIKSSLPGLVNNIYISIVNRTFLIQIVVCLCNVCYMCPLGWSMSTRDSVTTVVYSYY